MKMPVSIQYNTDRHLYVLKRLKARVLLDNGLSRKYLNVCLPI